MNGLQAYNYILQVLKRTDKSTEVYTAIADTVMDMRSRMLSDEYAKESAALTGIDALGEYILTLPTDFGHLIGDVMIRDTAADDTYLPLRKITKIEFDKIHNDNQSALVGNRNTGTPIDYCFFGKQIYVAPAVDKTTYEFKINYTLEDVPTYTSATTSIPFTDRFREVIRAGVLFRMFRELEQYDASTLWKSIYDDGINMIVADDEQNIGGSSLSTAYNGV